MYEGEAKTTPTVTGLTFLSQMYLQRGRLTGDVQTYLQAAAAADQAVSLAPADRTARTLAAGIHYTTHDFAAAEQAARTLVAERPTDAGPLAVLGDAQLELGDYAGATTTYGQLAGLVARRRGRVRAPGAAGVHPGPPARRRPAGQRRQGTGRRLGVR